MSGKITNLLLLLFFASLTYSISGSMKKWMDSKQVVQFEFLGTAAKADALINSAAWQSPDAAGRTSSERLQRATQWDFLYIIAYVMLFIALARTVLGAQDKRIKSMVLLLFAAGLADLLENVLLLQILDGARGFYPAAMFALASLKFGLLFLFLFWLFIAVILRFTMKGSLSGFS